MDAEQAHASWNGFNYQGKVSILVALEKINSIQEDEYKNWSLEIEGIDDFALIRDNKYQSLHQVKNYSIKNFSAFKDALIKLGKKAKGVEKYFHTRLGLPANWKEKLIQECQFFDVDDLNKLEEYKKDYLRFYEFGSTRKKTNIKSKAPIYVTIIKKAVNDGNIKSLDELTLEFIKESLLKVNVEREKFKNIDIDCLFEHSKYPKMSSDAVSDAIIDNIKIFWGDEKSSLKDKSIQIYYIYLLREIDKLISDRAEKENNKQVITFSEIVAILNKQNLSDDEEKILDYAAKIQSVYDEFCLECCTVSSLCEGSYRCNLGQIVKSIVTSKACDVFKILRILDISNNDNINDRVQELSNTDRLREILYEIISTVNLEFNLAEYKIISKLKDGEKYVMASTIKCGENGLKAKMIDKIINNEQLDKLFGNVDVEYEVDEIITQDISGCIDELRPSVYGNIEDDEKNSYFKITNNKNVKFITIDEACAEYGERKDV